MTPEERLDRMDKTMDRHIAFVAESLAESARQIAELTKQVNRTAAAQEVTEGALQKLIARVDNHEERLGRLDGGKS